MIKVTDGNQSLYFDWLIGGFSVRSNAEFRIEEWKDIGDFSMLEILEVCKLHSAKVFELETNN